MHHMQQQDWLVQASRPLEAEQPLQIGSTQLCGGRHFEEAASLSPEVSKKDFLVHNLTFRARLKTDRQHVQQAKALQWMRREMASWNQSQHPAEKAERLSMGQRPVEISR